MNKLPETVLSEEGKVDMGRFVGYAFVLAWWRVESEPGTFFLRTLEVIVGYLPKRALNLTIEWAIEHRSELMEDWNLCQARQAPKKIPPLE